MNKSHFLLRILAVTALVVSLLACSGDKGTGSDPEISFEIAGDHSVQIWSNAQIKITATSRSGAVPTLTAPELPANATFVDSSNGSGIITFSPAIEQLGNQIVNVLATTPTTVDSTTIQITVVDESAARKPLIPLALGNRWIYQSVHNRLDNDTITINSWSANDGRPLYGGSFHPTLWTLLDGIIQENDTVYSKTLGPQFVIPDLLPAEIYVHSRSACFWAMVTRQIEWSSEPITVPAGTFTGCFIFSCVQETVCESVKQQYFVEEIVIKPGVGIIKILQAKTSDCTGDCSSRWELLSWSTK